MSKASNIKMRRRQSPNANICHAFATCMILCFARKDGFSSTASALLTNPSTTHASGARVSFANPMTAFNVRPAHYNNKRATIDNSINNRFSYFTTSSRVTTSLQATTTTTDLIPPRRTRFTLELKTFLRVLFPAILTGTTAFLTLPSLCFRIANFVTRTTDPGKIGMLSDAVQSFISLVGLLYSILMGQVFGFLYSQQEALYLALFDEVTEAKSLLEQVALVSQGRTMYLTCLSSIAKYVREDLLGGTMTEVSDNISTTESSKKKARASSPSVTPSIILSARPADDPLESILYLTSVGIPGNIYDTVRSLRQARSRRLGAMQRKVPAIHLWMLGIMGVTLILTFPTLIGVGGAAWANGKILPSTGFNIWTLQGMLFGVATFAVVLTKMVLLELWRTKGGAYNVDSVLKVMVRGLECELDERMMEAKQTVKRSKTS